MAAQIEALHPPDVEGYLAYLRYAARLHRITGPVFIYDKPPTPASFLRVPVRDWFRVDAWRTMQQKIDRFVESPELRQLFGRFATYVGGSPFKAPATLNVIGHVELTGGVYYPRGGTYAIATALARLAADLGVDVRCNETVAGIEVGPRRQISGVRLSDGEVIVARQVISNVDVATTYRRLLPESVATPRALRRLTRVQPSCSGFILLLGIEGTHPQLAHHNIWFSSDYRREFDQIFAAGVPPDEPTVYAAITSKTDPDHAPAGSENWFILVNAPALDERYDWERFADGYRDLVLDRLAALGIELRDKIRVERRLTPVDIERLTGAHRGALYGASSNNPLTAFLRPHNRCPDVRGLYFAGGTTHPGGGVPMVTLSGKVAAELALADDGR
jgi:phytoene desaturase